ncbi:hypothetical protein [Polyangium fumosum]|uniref:Uncharacterized protein n=1 Tax=Polyangium fumosum TaxID=889272 RepID=A0A4V5PMH2_9BACT|nr:hypothetical protein [Polyangium fumosum]TKD03380.1 hypothetical protein E8A74_25780 [Polyangium fumosum]
MKTAAQREKHVRSFARDLNAWCKNPRLDQRKKLLADIEKWIRSGKPRAAAVAAGILRQLGNWYAQHGMFDVLNGRVESWAHLDRVLQYNWWDTRIDPGGTHVLDAAHTLAHALVFGEERMAAWLAARMIRSIDDKAFGSWDLSPFAVFMLELWHRYAGTPRPELDRQGIARIGVYRSVLDTWNDGQGFVTALLNACDYHLDEAVYSDANKEFLTSPYDLFPVDILAIAAVRAKQGLPMPELDHPLMQTPLAKLPPNNTRPRMPPDPLLEAVIEKARKQGFLPADGDVFTP